jgi:hypothetical protein
MPRQPASGGPDLQESLRLWDKVCSRALSLPVAPTSQCEEPHAPQGSRQMRERILQNFVSSSRNKTAPELEIAFGNGASLFLARVSAWLRLTYMLGFAVSLQAR